MIPQDLTGQTIGTYYVIKPIGSGGMAKIYLVRDSQQQLLAMKVLLPHLQNQPEFAERFLREAQHAKVLQHPHIVPVRDYKRLKEGITFFVMDWIDGGSLADYVRPNKLSFNQIAQVLTQVASALDYAHQRGIVHRDLKPSNILLTKTGQAMLADFGVAKVAQATTLTRPGEQPGTPAYMSPEQAQGAEVGPASDIYALGIVLYELLAGRPPFQGDTSQILAVLYQHVHQPPPPLRQFNPQVPSPIEKVVIKALAKKPTDRYATASDLAKAFRLAVNAAPTRSNGLIWSGLAASAVMLTCVLLSGAGLWLRNNLQYTAVTSTQEITPLKTDIVSADIQPLETIAPTNTPSIVAITTEQTALDTPIPVTITPPTLLTPPDKAIMEANETITLAWQWDKVLAENERFQITLRNTNQYNKTWSVRTPEYTLPDSLVAGDYTWLVSVESRNRTGKYERIALSKAAHFTVLAPPETATPVTKATNTSPKNTPTEKMGAPILIQPPDQLAESASKEITLQWKSAAPLSDHQCYVLYIHHRQGVDIIWLSDSRYVLGKAKVWLSSPDYGPDLSWEVVIAAKEGNSCEANSAAPNNELSPHSSVRGFRWVQD